MSRTMTDGMYVRSYVLYIVLLQPYIYPTLHIYLLIVAGYLLLPGGDFMFFFNLFIHLVERQSL